MVKPFKKGPDYIDAAWLSAAAHQDATNLDPFFLDASRIRELFIHGMENAGLANRPIALIEGNRGLYDGLNETGTCSTAQVARTLDSPILLCINCEKATRTIAALLAGLVSFEPGLLFAGVVLNRVGSSRHEMSLRLAIEANTDLKILGVLPRLSPNPLPERHMGLANGSHARDESLDGLLDNMAELVDRHCDVRAIMECAKAAPPMQYPAARESIPPSLHTSDARIGIVKDNALWFYYPENITALRQQGIHTTFITLLEDSRNNREEWNNLDGLYLGGGFPEDYARELASSPYLALIREYVEADMPVYAECGGMIVLCKQLRVKDKAWPMAGIFPAEAEWCAKPQGLGYVQAKVVCKNFYYPLGAELLGHEFHYTRCSWQVQDFPMALELERGAGLAANAGEKAMDGAITRQTWGSWMHIFAPAVPCWAENFAKLARDFRMKKI